MKKIDITSKLLGAEINTIKDIKNYYFFRYKSGEESREDFTYGDKTLNSYEISSSKPTGKYSKYNDKNLYKYFYGDNLEDFKLIFDRFKFDEPMDFFYLLNDNPNDACLILTNDGLFILIILADSLKGEIIDLLDGDSLTDLDNVIPEFINLENYGSEGGRDLFFKKEIVLESNGKQLKKVFFSKDGKKHFLIGSDYPAKVDEYGFFVDDEVEGEDDENYSNFIYLFKKPFFRIKCSAAEWKLYVNDEEEPLTEQKTLLDGSRIFWLGERMLNEEKYIKILLKDSDKHLVSGNVVLY